MKKLLLILLAIAMCFSVCACGNSGTTKPENSSKLNLEKFINDVKQNEVNANENYSEKAVIVSAFVEDIKSNQCSLVIYDKNLSQACRVIVPLSKDELMSLKVNERINVVGTVEKASLVSGMPYLYLKSASVIDNKTSIEGTVLSLVYGQTKDEYPTYCTVSIKGFFDGVPAVYCNVYMDGKVLKELKEGDVITVTGTFFAYDNSSIHLHKGSKILGELKNAEIVAE